MRIEHGTMGKQSALRIICALALATSGSVRAQTYSALDLGTLGGSYSTARGLGSMGQVWGYTSTAGNASYPSFLTGPNGTGMADIASLGSIVGMDTAGRLLLATGRLTGPNGIGTTDLGGINGSAISDSGRVVGSSGGRIVVTGAGGVGMNDVAGIGRPTGVNDSGRVIGNPASNVWPSKAVVTGPDGIGITELAVEGYSSSDALDINNAGQVVGYTTRRPQIGSPFSRAFITGPDGMGMRDLGAFGGTPQRPSSSFALGINGLGQVVGYSNDDFIFNPGAQYTYGSGYSTSAAFVTGPDGVGMFDLNGLVTLGAGEKLLVAWGINDVGQIVATSNNRAYLLTPISAIPEPSVYMIVLSGLALTGYRRRKNATNGRTAAAAG